MNAKVEFIKHIVDREVVCAEIYKGPDYYDPEGQFQCSLILI